jgi:glycosyltransferase involved in cell wall biosynthesis
MTASVITFANLGKKKNLKTIDIVPVLDILIETGELTQIICQITKDFSFSNTSSAFPVAVRYALGVLRKLGIHISRQKVERLFDFFASRKLEPVDVVFLHGGYFLVQSSRRAHAQRSIVIDLTVSAHHTKNALLEKEEFITLGFPEYSGLYTKLEQRSVSITSDYVIAISDFVKDTYLQIGIPENRIFVATPDIDISRFAPVVGKGTTSSSFKLLYIAHTQPLKGLHYLLDAWKDFTCTNAELVIVGGFSDMPAVLRNEYMESMHNDSRITYVPGTATPELYYSDASAFIFPSLTEGFGRVTLEAMACGLPVITTEHARGIVEDGVNGFVVPIRDAQALRDKIQFLYDNPEKRIAMGKAARLAVENKKPFGIAVYEIYQEILKRENLV